MTLVFWRWNAIKCIYRFTFKNFQIYQTTGGVTGEVVGYNFTNYFIRFHFRVYYCKERGRPGNTSGLFTSHTFDILQYANCTLSFQHKVVFFPLWKISLSLKDNNRRQSDNWHDAVYYYIIATAIMIIITWNL